MYTQTHTFSLLSLFLSQILIYAWVYIYTMCERERECVCMCFNSLYYIFVLLLIRKFHRVKNI